MGHWHSTHWFLNYTDGSASVLKQCLDAVQTAIRLESLSGVASGSVLVKKLPLERVKANDSVAFPLCLITPGRHVLPPSAGDNIHDDVIYEIRVTFIDDDDQERTLEANLGTYTTWLQQTRRAFHNKRLTGVSSVYNCTVEQGDTVFPRAWQQGRWMSQLTIRCSSREHRNA